MPNSKPLCSPEALDGFLELVESGTAPFDAARAVAGPIDGHETLRRIRSHAGRHPEFAARLTEAEAAYRAELVDQLGAEGVRRALDAEAGGNGASNRMLHLERVHRDRDYRETVMEVKHAHLHTGTVTHALYDPERLHELLEAGEVSAEQVEAWALVQRLLIVGAEGAPLEPPPSPAAELEAGPDDFEEEREEVEAA